MTAISRPWPVVALLFGLVMTGCFGGPSPTAQATPSSAPAPVSAADAARARSAGLGAFAQLAAAQALANSSSGAPPTAAPGEIRRTELYEDVVTISGARFQMVVAELIFGPGAETPVHSHPGPSTGYLQDGRLTVTIASSSHKVTYSAGSVVEHPWNVPHVFANTGDETARMLSFELVPTT